MSNTDERNFGKTILSSDKLVKFDFMTSLQNIVIAKIASILWMNNNNLQHIANFIHSGIRPRHREASNRWQQIKNSIEAKASELPLPKYITENLNIVVPVIGNSILNWIMYHECILNPREYLAVDQIKHIAWTTRGKIDFARTAKNVLADTDTCLCDDHKYKLACTYCLEDEIAILAPNVVNQCYLDSVQIDMHPMVYFWTARITGDNIELYNHYRDSIKLNNISINEYIIQMLINSNNMSCRSFNEVPIKYMWAKLSEEEKAKNIVSTVKELSNQELRCTLLSNLDLEMQQEVFEECSYNILLGILNDWLWRENFLPTALNVLDVMRPLSIFLILKEINKGMIKHSQEENRCAYNEYVYIFKQLWKGGCEKLKNFIFEQENEHFLENFVFSLILKQDMDLIEFILNDLNAKQRKDIIFLNHGLEQCVDFIKNDRWDLLEQFINYTLSSEKDINKLKKRLINNKGEEIAIHFLDLNALDKIEHFMSWAFMSKREIGKFRKSLSHIKRWAAVESVISNNEIDFTNLENHFKWCAEGDLDIVKQFKAEIPKSYSGKVISQLIEDDKYELLDKFFNWCFSDNKTKIAQFKSNIYKDYMLGLCFGTLIFILIRKDNSFQLLDKFVHWCFIDEQVKEFKEWLLYCHNFFRGFCCSILVENQFELADNFLKWCATSHENICHFKRDLMFSHAFVVIIIRFPRDDLDFPSLFKWLNPSEEMVETFKRRYSDDLYENNLHKFLHDSVRNRNKRKRTDICESDLQC